MADLSVMLGGQDVSVQIEGVGLSRALQYVREAEAAKDAAETAETNTEAAAAQALTDISTAETNALDAIGEDNSSGARGAAISAIGVAEASAIAAVDAETEDAETARVAAEAAQTAAEAAQVEAEAARDDILALTGLTTEYSDVVTYDAGDKVYHEGSSYECQTDGTVGIEPTPEGGGPWQIIALGGEAFTSEGLTIDILAGSGGFGADGTLGLRMQNGGVTAGYLDWSAANPFRVRNAANSAHLLSLSSAGLLTASGGVAAGGAITGTTINASGIVTVAASGTPMVVNSTNSTAQKVANYDNGSLVSYWGANATTAFVAYNSSGVALFSVLAGSGTITNRISVTPTATGGTPVIAPAGSDSEISQSLQWKGSTSQVLIGNASELRVSSSRVLAGVPIQFPSYTVATLPTATAGRAIYVSDGTSNKRFAIADGTNFRWPDGAVVS